MIIQCRSCATRYRFDETLIEGEGVWVRCSRCGNVFFQSSPELPVDNAALGPSTSEEADRPGQTLRTEEGPGQTSPESALPRVEAENDRPQTAAGSPPESEILTKPDDDDVQIHQWEKISPRTDEDDEYTPPWKRSKGQEKPGSLFGRIMVTVVVCLVIATALGFAFYQFYPHQSRQLLQAVTVQVPLIGRLLGLEDPGPPIAHSLLFTNLRQRTDHNLIVGSVRVVEGTLINNSRHYLARLQIKGEIFDAQGKLIGERMVFCGNILTSDELKNLAETDILKILNHPEGNALINARVPPGGQVPFMLVFIREHPGGIRTQVRVAGYERLL